MIALYGVGVSHGIAIGKVHVLKRNQLDITEYCILEHEIEEEVNRFHNALSVARQQLRAVRDHMPRDTASDIAGFIDAHLLMLEDSALTSEPVNIIRNKRCNAEWSLKLQRDALVSVFDEMDDPYLRTRKDDIGHVVARIQRILLNHGPLRHEIPDNRLHGYIIVSDDLTPADTVLMQHHGIAAFATESGGPTSHTAILARSLGIPSIVGLHDALRYIKEDELVIVDGSSGVLLVGPDQKTLDHYRARREEQKRYYDGLITLREAPARTLDGIEIKLQANIELPGDFETVRRVGAKGVGLYRTEYLYLNREVPPGEEEHLETYLELLRALGNIPATIRTFDLGADKQMEGRGREGPIASNPALGLRAIRLCLKEPSIFRPQVRAILRASAHGPLRMMIPMLSNVQEIRQVLDIVRDIRADLRDKNIDYNPNMEIGAMIEVPAAALCAEAFAEKMDFLSIGTNDLIQYTMAIDRVNDEVNYLYDPMHPAVLRLIKMTLDAGLKYNKPVAMCGEMAGDLRFTRLLLGMGLREFSVHPAVMLEVKRIITESRVDSLQEVASHIFVSANGQDVAGLLKTIN